MFFVIEQHYDMAYFKKYLKTYKEVTVTTKATFDIFMHALFIYLLVYFIKKR
jgi:hypothetical protein